MKRVLLLNMLLLVACFVAWCVADYYAVKSPQYPEDVADHDWVGLLVPVVIGAANYFVQRKRGLKRAIVTAIIAAVVVSVLLVGAIISVGIPFHLSIGGRL